MLGAAIILPALALGVPSAATAAAGGPDPALTQFYVSTTGTNTGNHCMDATHPCATIQHAVDVAESTAGATMVNVAPGTYAEQVTVHPPTGSPMTSLDLVGHSTSSDPVIVQPTSVTANICEKNTGLYLDDISAPVSAVNAIIGVETGIDYDSTATPCTSGTLVANPPTVTVSGFTATGASLTSSGPLEGIGFIETSGAVTGNHVEHVQLTGHLGAAQSHGIEVKSGYAAITAQVTHNIVDHLGGHVSMDVLSSPGLMSANILGNSLMGDPAATFPNGIYTQNGLGIHHRQPADRRRQRCRCAGRHQLPHHPEPD